jgi:hypothetical protein
MPYFALPNFKHDSGPNRIQSGPDHQGYTVLFSGVQSTGVDEGIVLYASPLSGTLLTKAWDFDSNWRYIPSTLPGQSISLDPTPYDASEVLDTYRAARIYIRDDVAGAQAASAIGPETGKVNPRGGALQARANVTRPETYMYFGGGAPDNQDYSPYNTPDANTAAEGKTGGGVTHRNYESSLLTNLLGSQGTSDRSQWRYHQPVYCKTFTETRRSATPGLMSSPLRYVYRGPSTSYNYNYAGELLANKGGFELLPPDDQVFGCPFPAGCPTTTGSTSSPRAGDTLTATPVCTYASIQWFNSSSSISIGSGPTYVIQNSDVGKRIYYTVTYLDGSTDSSDLNCLNIVQDPPFDPTRWKYARLSGVRWSDDRIEDVSGVYFSPWEIVNTGNIMRVFTTASPNVIPNYDSLDWTSTTKLYASFPTSGFVGGVLTSWYYENAGGSILNSAAINTINNTNTFLSGQLIATLDAVWQFSDDQVNIAAAWSGVWKN